MKKKGEKTTKAKNEFKPAVDEPLRGFQPIDWIALANQRKNTFDQRFQKELRDNPEYTKEMFIEDEIKWIDNDLADNFAPENSKIFKRYSTILRAYKTQLSNKPKTTGHNKKDSITFADIIKKDKLNPLLELLREAEYINQENKWVKKKAGPYMQALYIVLEKDKALFNEHKPAATETTYKIMLDFFKTSISITAVKNAQDNSVELKRKELKRAITL